MRTLSTFSFGALACDMELDELVEPAAVDVDEELDGIELDECSTVPVISTLCPTCGVSLESSASRR